MRIAVISDIHGNLVALTSVIESIANEGVDMTMVLGDVVSFGPESDACVRVVSALYNSECLLGNHDRIVATQDFLTESFQHTMPEDFVESYVLRCGNLALFLIRV